MLKYKAEVDFSRRRTFVLRLYCRCRIWICLSVNSIVLLGSEALPLEMDFEALPRNQLDCSDTTKTIFILYLKLHMSKKSKNIYIC